ncbi:MAG: GTP pyrophosphokinase [Anaerolineae bacterium]|nr:GTP pyrophosphokinase [Anaerolineae bacterium]
MPSLEDAILLAVQAHAGQKDKDDVTPYVLHPLRMMVRVQFDFFGSSEEAMMVAVLHDVVEDTGVTLADLRRAGYPEAVVDAVDHLTRREGESYEAFVERAAAHPLARRVKLADLEDNMDIRRLPAVTPDDLARLQRYRRAWEVIKGKEEQM